MRKFQKRGFLWRVLAGKMGKRCLKKVIESGGVALVEGDTVLGLMAGLTESGFNALNHIKGRFEKPYLILVSSKTALLPLIDSQFHEQHLPFLDKVWPGPVTIIFKANQLIQPFLKGSQGTVGLRIPNHRDLLDILQEYPGLFSTSANRAGEVIPDALAAVDRSILKSVGCVLVNNESDQQVTASTIVDLSSGDFKVIREGAYPIAKLYEQYQR